MLYTHLVAMRAHISLRLDPRNRDRPIANSRVLVVFETNRITPQCKHCHQYTLARIRSRVAISLPRLGRVV